MCGGVELHDYLCGFQSVEREASVVGGDGEFAEAAINKDGELHLFRAAVVEKFVEGGLHGAAGEEDVVNEDDGCARHISGDECGRVFLGDGVAADVVAVEGDVEGAGFGRELRVWSGEPGGQTVGEGNAAVGDAKQEDFSLGAVALGNCLGDPPDSGVNLGGGNAL